MKASVTISRRSDNVITISIRDDASFIQFVEATMSVEAFGYAVTGLSSQEADIELNGVQYVGKKRICENRTARCPLNTYNREELRAWLRENMQEEGWLLSDYLGSQGAVKRIGDETILNYSVTKYVDEPKESQE